MSIGPWNWVTPFGPVPACRDGNRPAREGDGRAGVRSGKKRRRGCNGPDKRCAELPGRKPSACNITLAERQPTSQRCSPTRKGKEPLQPRIVEIPDEQSEGRALAEISCVNLHVSLNRFRRLEPAGASRQRKALGVLEPCEVKVSRTVLRGLGPGNGLPATRFCGCAASDRRAH